MELVTKRETGFIGKSIRIHQLETDVFWVHIRDTKSGRPWSTGKVSGTTPRNLRGSRLRPSVQSCFVGAKVEKPTVNLSTKKQEGIPVDYHERFCEIRSFFDIKAYLWKSRYVWVTVDRIFVVFDCHRRRESAVQNYHENYREAKLKAK